MITENKEFIAGKNGTIISMGAWGDIFQTDRFIDMSINLIIELIKLGNPIQFMSKYKLDISLISKLAKYVQYTNQVLYSTTITTIDKWKTIEPNTVSPEERIKTCKEFKNQGIESNVLIKPFILGTTDLELDKIIYLLKEYNITYCVIGKLYISDDILKSLGKDCLINADALTGLDVKDFELLCSLGVFNAGLMNDAIFKFKRYEDSSLSYTGINKHENEDIGGWDTVIKRKEYEQLFYNQQATMSAENLDEEADYYDEDIIMTDTN